MDVPQTGLTKRDDDIVLGQWAFFHTVEGFAVNVGRALISVVAQ